MVSPPRATHKSRVRSHSLRLLLCVLALSLAPVFSAAPALAQVFPSPTPTPTPSFPIEIPGEISTPRPGTVTPAATATSEATPALVPETTPTPSERIYLPAVVDALPTLTQSVLPVFGLTGHISVSPTTGRPMITLASGRVYWLVGENLDVNERMDPLAHEEPAPLVKVWGTLYEQGEQDPLAYIIVTDIQRTVPAPVSVTPPATASPATPPAATSTPATAPAATATSAPPKLTPRPSPATATPTPAPALAIARFDAVNLRATPNTNAPRIGQIVRGQTCEISERTANGAWIFIRCSTMVTGWIEPRFVTVTGSLDDVPVTSSGLEGTATPAHEATPVPTAVAPTPSPTPSPTNTPTLTQGWRAVYFPNPNLRGVPSYVGETAFIGYDWGTGAPRSGMPADYFSVAWEGVIDFDPGFYILSASADDGFRVLIDGEAAMDQWSGAGQQTYRVGRQLSGVHTIRVEYNDQSGSARMFFNYVRQPDPLRWAASYANLPGMPTGLLTQQESDAGLYRLDYYWGDGSPTTAPGHNWTARWVGSYDFAYGNYVFHVQGKDGYRVTLDGQVLINKWSDGYEEQRARFVDVGEGSHTVAIDFYSRNGPASLRVWWNLESPASGQPQ